MNSVKNVCTVEGIAGSGKKGWVTTHGLRGTLATLLFENGHSDSSVALRTGHRDPRSLKSYQNLRGIEGMQQQRDVLGCVGNQLSSKQVRLNTAPEMGAANAQNSAVNRPAPLSHVGAVSGGTVNVTVNYYGPSN